MGLYCMKCQRDYFVDYRQRHCKKAHCARLKEGLGLTNICPWLRWTAGPMVKEGDNLFG